MPLDDHEQQILDEIERQFYEQDPDLAHAVRNIERSTRFGMRLPVVGAVGGVAVMILFFTVSSFLAVLGFVLLVVSATSLVNSISVRMGAANESGPVESEPRQRMFRRFRRG